jgi:hypothetical protein
LSALNPQVGRIAAAVLAWSRRAYIDGGSHVCRIPATPARRFLKEQATMERKPNPIVLILIGHALIGAVTWRDIKRRPAEQVRGSKTLWRILSAVNTLGSVGYWLIGRRYAGSRSR